MLYINEKILLEEITCATKHTFSNILFIIEGRYSTRRIRKSIACMLVKDLKQDRETMPKSESVFMEIIFSEENILEQVLCILICMFIFNLLLGIFTCITTFSNMVDVNVNNFYNIVFKIVKSSFHSYLIFNAFIRQYSPL